MQPPFLQAFAAPEVRSVKVLAQLAVVAVAAMLACGCASRQALIVAQANPDYALSTTNRYCLAASQPAAPGEVPLVPILTNHLRDMGIELVPTLAADYSIACWMNVSRERIGSQYVRGSAPFASFDMYGRTSVAQWPSAAQSELITTSIRIRIYPTRLTNLRQLAPAWDAFADAGIRVSEQRASDLLEAMLHYLGEDFDGRVKLENAR